MEVDDGSGLERPERPRLDQEPGEHRGREHHVGGQPARPGENPERRVVPHARPPASTVAPSAVTMTWGRSTSPPRKAAVAATSAAVADEATTVTRIGAPAAGRPLEGSMRW